MAGLKVTLIQPRYFNIWEALGLGYIAAYCKKNFKGRLDISYFQGYFDDDALIVSQAKDSDIVGFSCTSPTYKEGLALAGRLKEANRGIRIVFGGYHPSALAGEVSSNANIDQVVCQEGEKAFLSILEGNKEGVVRGIPADFSELPCPDREVIKNHREVELCFSMTGKRIASFQSGRGCPFHCVFCAEHAISAGNSIRARDADDLLDEIEGVSGKYRLDMFKFVDATWNTSIAKAVDFCKKKIKRGNSTQWECHLHAAIADEEMFYWMARANCLQVNIGCESGSPRILKQMNKGISVEQIIKVFGWARKYGILRRGFFSIGMPDESAEDIRLTESLVEQIDPDVFGVTILCPYPGSALYDRFAPADVDWSLTDEYNNDFWRTKYLTNQDLKYWQRYLADRFKDSLAWHHKAVS